ncbi:ciliated left-right organizer metallopeptidase [Tenrec ecaudatus]|uniref:ciliated left-right organizer metallopeptidase n=1 Tax=Tenrec ecaudatus TaxID=94439 RepID=UPI003F5A03A0
MADDACRTEGFQGHLRRQTWHHQLSSPHLLILLLLLLLFLRAATSKCLHDEAQKSVNLLRPPLSPPLPNSRSSVPTFPGSRDPQPLRIQPCFIEDPVSDGGWNPEGGEKKEDSRAASAVREATQQIRSILAVPPVQGPLLLNRDLAQYCHAVWGDPDASNYHRCSLLNPGYKGESCLGAKIPDFHLRGYAVWPEQGPPQLVQPDGPGVPNTDFLLYVRVAHTSKCHREPSLIAYAACCQLDSEDRPLAGTLVYCARHLTSASLSHNDLVTATLHELLHVLGFSGQLFKKWKDCPSGPSASGNCSTRQRVTRRDAQGQMLLTTPAVSRRLAQHLGVLGVLQGVPLEEEEGPLSSHWEARLLQGSIMTAAFHGAQRTRLDPITLAAFEDSGWYQVNYSAAQELLWGQGSGPEFGLVAICGTASSDFFCTGSGLGCHYLHLDKGRCSSDATLEGCRMYKPLVNRSECWKKENGFPPGAENPHGEVYQSQSRCFLANLTSQLLSEDTTRHPSVTPPRQEGEPSGRCYLTQCTESGAYKVRVAGSPWVPCLPGKAIQIPGYYGLLSCPRARLCRTNEGANALTSPSTIFSTQDLQLQLSLRLAGPRGPSLGKEQQEELTKEVLQALVSRSGTGRCYFHGPSMNESLVFTVHIWKPPGCQGPPAGMLHRTLTLALQKQLLKVSYGGVSYTIEHRLLATSDTHRPMVPVGLFMGLCLVLILVGTLGTVAYQKRATLQVGPSVPYNLPVCQGTRDPTGGIREV